MATHHKSCRNCQEKSHQQQSTKTSKENAPETMFFTIKQLSRKSQEDAKKDAVCPALLLQAAVSRAAPLWKLFGG